MRRGALADLLLIGVLVGGLVSEGLHPSHEPSVSNAPHIAQPAAHRHTQTPDEAVDVREGREPTIRQATPSSAKTVPAPVGAESAYVPGDSASGLASGLQLLIIVLAGLAWAA